MIIKKTQTTQLNYIEPHKFGVPNLDHLILPSGYYEGLVLKSLKNFNTIDHFRMSEGVGYNVLAGCYKGDVTVVVAGYDVAFKSGGVGWGRRNWV